MSSGGSEPARVARRLEIKNRLGLHARAAALMVQTVSQFDAEITVSKDDQTVNGRSILGLMMLAAGQPRHPCRGWCDGAPDVRGGRLVTVGALRAPPARRPGLRLTP